MATSDVDSSSADESSSQRQPLHREWEDEIDPPSRYESDGSSLVRDDDSADEFGTAHGGVVSDPSSVTVTMSPPIEPPVFDDEEDYIRIAAISGYVFDWTLELRYWLLALCTAGMSCLAGYWFPRLLRRYRYRRVYDMIDAEYVGVESIDGECDFLPIERISTHPSVYVPRVMGTLWYGPRHLTERAHPKYIELSERMFIFRHHRFFLDMLCMPPTFIKQREPLQEAAGVLQDRLKVGLSYSEFTRRQRLFGVNQLQIMVPTYPALLVKEIFHPFFIFQIYSVLLWCAERYYIFAVCIAVIATVSIVTTLLETHSRLENLSQLARFETELNVLRHDAMTSDQQAVRVKKVSSVQLVVGDIIEVETGLVPCDLTILSGGAVVNESMLTGEAVPVIKTSLQFPIDPNGLVSLGIEARSTLYSATKILQLKPSTPGGKVYGMVVRTGFATTKGSLILSILFPKPSSFKFVEQSFRFIGCLFCLSLIGFSLSVWQLYEHGATITTMLIRGLDLITIVVPPSLPLALSVGVNFALVALKSRRIFCISPSRINLAGKIQWMNFDKTGTLTSEGMELMGVLPSANAIFSTFYETASSTDASTELDSDQLPDADGTSNVAPGTPILGGVMVRGGKLLGYGTAAHEKMAPLTDAAGAEPTSPPSPRPRLSQEVLSCMSCCHAIASLDGELIGDPLEIEIFKATRATLRDTSRDGFVSFVSCPNSPDATDDANATEWGVRMQFEFVPALQRMSVIVANQHDASDLRALAKGSPEMMRGLCRPETIPRDFDRHLRTYAHKGYRVIAIGWKPLASVPHIEKEDLRLLVESDLIFLGLVVLENKVKPETAPTLKLLSDALVRSVMVTGDHAITGVAIAKDCGLVDPGTRIFLGTLVNDESTGRTRLEWVNTDEDSDGGPTALRLNPRTLAFDGARELGNQHFKYELAVTGAVFKYLEDRHLAETADRRPHDYLANPPAEHDPDEESATRYFHRVILNCLVFARMTPDQKASLISHLQSLGIYTGMCGDGANDVGALKAGHIGVSLSDSEASIAAPFTYQRPNISCIPVLLSEGRSALTTSFALFRYMAMYSMIQFTAVIMVYFRGSVLGNWEYLLQDMFIVFPLTIALGGTRASPHLSIKRPSGNLLSIGNIANMFGHMVICMCFQAVVFTLSQKQSDFYPYEDAADFTNGPRTYESTSMYYYSNFQFIVMAILFARGAPWKASLLTNRRFSGWAIVTLGVSLAILFSQHQGSFFREEEVPIGAHWRWIMFVIALADAACNILFNTLLYPALLARFKRWKKSRWPMTKAFGKVKNTAGPQSKLWHRLRGDFEANWDN